MSELLLVLEEKAYIPRVHNYVLEVPMRSSNNDLKMLAYLSRHFHESYSINQLAKKIGLTPKGVYNLLKRLEKENLVVPQKMANAIFYHVNFESDKAIKASELAFFEEPKVPYARVQAKDLEKLRPWAQAALLFGSVLQKGKEAGDIDVLVVLEQSKMDQFRKELAKIQDLKPKNIHIIYQTYGDLVKNLKKPDAVVLDALDKGVILWGQGVLISAIKEASLR